MTENDIQALTESFGIVTREIEKQLAMITYMRILIHQNTAILVSTAEILKHEVGRHTKSYNNFTLNPIQDDCVEDLLSKIESNIKLTQDFDETFPLPKTDKEIKEEGKIEPKDRFQDLDI